MSVAETNKLDAISREVWKLTGWGTGEPECAEGYLCVQAVKAGWNEALELAAQEAEKEARSLTEAKVTSRIAARIRALKST